jgi:co-chaperonin GroES (HSP10)
MKAINYYVVIEKIKEKPKSDSGFVLTETQNEDIRYLKGRVISVGDLVNGITEGNIVQ